MNLNLDGARVLVTAGAGGIGCAIADAFAAEGAKVLVCDVNASALKRIGSGMRGIQSCECDVSDRLAVSRLFERVADVLGGLDCLVNNAGIAGPTGRVDEIDPEAWDRTLAINLTGQFNCARLAVSHLIKSRNPSIINISSVAGRLGFKNRSAYAASKWAVIGFTKSLSLELGGFGIRVNAVLPGVVDGERQEAVLAANARIRNISIEQMKAIALEHVSIKEFIVPQQVAETILFLASPRARSTSGQAISVCGDLQSLS